GHLVAVDPREITVEHDDVVVVDPELLKCGVTVVGGVHGHGLAAETDRDRVGQNLFVFDHEYAHVGPSTVSTANKRGRCRRIPHPAGSGLLGPGRAFWGPATEVRRR